MFGLPLSEHPASILCCAAAPSQCQRPSSTLAHLMQAGQEAPAATGTQSQQAADAGEQAGTSHQHASRSEDAPGQLCPAVHRVLFMSWELSPDPGNYPQTWLTAPRICCQQWAAC